MLRSGNKLIMKKVFFVILILAAVFGAGFYLLYFPPAVRSADADSRITIKFDKPVKRQKISHIITPDVLGEWSFEDSLIRNHLFRTLVFTPAIGFEPDTEYTVNLENITNAFGFGGKGDFSFSFRTAPIQELSGVGLRSIESLPEPKVTLIDVPPDWQDYPLSCEAASLKMALAAKDISVSEDKIMEKIGYDMSPHIGNFWGDPDKAFVGNIYGKMCETGYGVYWEPVAKASSHWRNSESFSGWTLGRLIQELESGNPVVFWGVLSNGGPLNDCSWWYSKEGKRVKAFKETHVRVAIGFIGDAENPSKIIINDPLSGRLYWDTGYFMKNWEIFGNSGVVVR